MRKTQKFLQFRDADADESHLARAKLPEAVHLLEHVCDFLCDLPYISILI